MTGRRHVVPAFVADSPAATGEIPPERAGSATVATTRYSMLVAAQTGGPEDVQLASSPEVRGRDDLGNEELERLRKDYFARPRACLRASPLPKTFGWGLQYDADCRITLHAVDSAEYARLSSDRALNHLRAMRSSRERT